MTPPELKEAMQKFTAYLEANGIRVLCHAMYIEDGEQGEIVVQGKGMLIEMLLIAETHKRGWKVIPK